MFSEFYAFKKGNFKYKSNTTTLMINQQRFWRIVYEVLQDIALLSARTEQRVFNTSLTRTVSVRYKVCFLWFAKENYQGSNPMFRSFRYRGVQGNSLPVYMSATA